MKPRQPPRTSVRGEVPTPAGRTARAPGRCGGRPIGPRPTQGEVFLYGKKEDRMSIESLKCKECGTAYELDASYVCENCFGPLEVAYDYSSLDPVEVKRRIQAGSQGIWRYADFLPFAGPSQRPAGAGADAAGPGRPSGRAARDRGRALDQERRRQPDPLLQGPGRRRRRRQGPGAGLLDRRLRLDRQPRQRRRRPRRRGRARLLRLRPRQPRGAEAARDRRLRDQPGRRPRQLRRRQPALHAAGRDPSLGLRQRQPAALLRRGLEDARLRDRRAARLGAAGPGRLPDRLRLALHQARPRLPGVARPRPGRGRAADLQRRPGRGLQPGRHRLRRRLGRLQAAEAGDDRQEPGDRRPGRRPLRGRARAPHRRRHRLGRRR